MRVYGGYPGQNMIVVSTALSDRDSLTVRASYSENVEITDVSTTAPPRTVFKFWLIFASMCTCLFLSALELSSISTALPTIAHELRATQFVWVGSAYALSSTAFLPMSGGLAQAFDIVSRRRFATWSPGASAALLVEFLGTSLPSSSPSQPYGTMPQLITTLRFPLNLDIWCSFSRCAVLLGDPVLAVDRPRPNAPMLSQLEFAPFWRLGSG
ncbi:hypothetical protein OG21DRAFT_1488769 [Imleria badia]|nr:hypothetical protein OG21DRAFT_1488769 [Imleria badia]